MRLRAVAALLVAAIACAEARSAPGTDCPLAFQPYSVNSPLIDLLINPATKAAVDRDAPEFAQRLPAMFMRTEPPSFAAIVTPAILQSWVSLPGPSLAKLEEALQAIPVAAADAVARCARYDEVPPKLPAIGSQPALLVFTKINGFRDDPSVDAGTAALNAMAKRRGWNLVFTDKGAAFNAKTLRRFKAVIWNNISGDVLTLTQQRAFKTWLEQGGGFAGFHGSGGDFYYAWDWYADTLIGARFLGHPRTRQFQAARVHIDDPGSDVVKGLADWTMTEEWYSFKSNPRARGAHVLATLDESSYSAVDGDADFRMGDHPIAWTQCIGDGRSFYTAIGHRPESYTEPNSVSLLERGIAWAAGLGSTQCRAGHELSR